LRARLAAGHPAVTSIAVSDLDPANAEKLAELVNGRSHGDDNLAVIEDPEVTAVIVSTSEGEHLASMLAAIERGKPVLVEKPIALTVREADQVLDALKRVDGDLLGATYKGFVWGRQMPAKDNNILNLPARIQ
jgi:myo-inositol 2-dehydrogenase/D-chiro-inositol 1-dehydrogenase